MAIGGGREPLEGVAPMSRICSPGLNIVLILLKLDLLFDLASILWNLRTLGNDLQEL